MPVVLPVMMMALPDNRMPRNWLLAGAPPDFSPISLNLPTTHQSLHSWVEQIQRLCEPDEVHWCDGSDEESNRLCGLLVERGTFTRLDPEKRPNSFLARSAPSDVARVEDRTFICTRRQDEAGPSNNWAHPDEMRKTLLKSFGARCAAARCMSFRFAWDRWIRRCRSSECS